MSDMVRTERIVRIPVGGVCKLGRCQQSVVYIGSGKWSFQRSGPDVGSLKTQALRRSQRALQLQGVVVGFARVGIKIRVVELGIGGNPVLREQSGGNGWSVGYGNSAGDVDTSVGSAHHSATFSGGACHHTRRSRSKSIENIQSVCQRHVIPIRKRIAERRV